MKTSVSDYWCKVIRRHVNHQWNITGLTEELKCKLSSVFISKITLKLTAFFS